MHHRWREIQSYFHGEGATRDRLRQAMLQRVLGRVHSTTAVVAPRGHLPSDPMQVLPEIRAL
jgi:hypothetical protein